MTHSQIDRRVARTREALQHALISLILRKGYDVTTVEDICSEANVGRSTFYGHYTSKDDLKRSGLVHLHKSLVTHQHNHQGQNLSFSLAMFEHAHKNVDLYRALSKGGGADMALRIIRDIVVDLAGKEVSTKQGEALSDTVPREIAVQFIAGAFMSILTWWLETGAILPPAQIDTVFRKLTTGGYAT